MSATFTAYPRLHTPNEVIEKMAEFIISCGYEIVRPLDDDLDIFDKTRYDGKRIVFLDKTGNYFIHLRSCNNYNIFGSTDEIIQDSVEAQYDKRYKGVGMIVSEAYSHRTRWYNQRNVPVKYRSTEALGVYMPVDPGKEPPVVDPPLPVIEPDPVTPPDPPVYPDPPEEPMEPIEDSIEEPEAPIPRCYIYNIDNSNFWYIGSSRYATPGNNSMRMPDGRVGIGSVGDEVDAVTPKIAYDPDILNYYSSVLPDYVLVIVPVAMTSRQQNKYGSSAIIVGTADITNYVGGYDINDNYNNNPNNPARKDFSAMLPTIAQMYNLRQDLNGNLVSDDRVYQKNSTYYNSGSDQEAYKLYAPNTTIGWYDSLFSTYNYYYGSNVYSNSSYSYRLSHDERTYRGLSTIYRYTYNYSSGRSRSIMYGTELAFMKKSDFEGAMNFSSDYGAWLNKTSQDWLDYYDTKDRLHAEYEEKLAQYEEDMEVYNILMEQYEAEVELIKLNYELALEEYNNYLRQMQEYQEYQGKLKLYNAYLEEVRKGSYYYTLYCNEVLDSVDHSISTLAFSLVKLNDEYMQTSHLIVGNLVKYDNWFGGIIFSGSANRYNMLESIKLYEHNQTSDTHVYPVFSTGTNTNTFLRINVDDAPKPTRGSILWASSGTDNITGVKMALPIRLGNYAGLDVPHYYFLQSKSRLDSGKNINRLNCMTVNLPIYVSVCRDDGYYAAAGEVLGVYFISTYNIQTASVYEIHYPDYDNTCQAFSVGKRRGAYGFDGISIKQMDTPISYRIDDD